MNKKLFFNENILGVKVLKELICEALWSRYLIALREAPNAKQVDSEWRWEMQWFFNRLYSSL